MISEATITPEAIGFTEGERNSKLYLETFPEVELSCRTLVLGSLCVAKDPSRWFFVQPKTQRLCYADVLMATSDHQHCGKPALLFSQTRGVELLGSVTKPII